MGKINKTGRSKGRDRYVEVPYYMIKCYAWRCLSVHSRSAWIELMTEYYGSNNGKIVMSARMLGERLNCSQVTAWRATRELITYGFVEVGTASSFSKKRLAAEYRMTHLRCDLTGELPTKTFMKLSSFTSEAKASHSFMGETHSFISGAP